MASAARPDWGHTRNYGEAVATTIDEEVKRIVTEAYDEALRILQENMEVLHAAAKLLVEKEKVTGDEFRTLFDPNVREEILGIAENKENTEPETRRHVLYHNGLRRASAQQPHNILFHIHFRAVHPVLARKRHRIAARHTRRDDGNAVYRVKLAQYFKQYCRQRQALPVRIWRTF